MAYRGQRPDVEFSSHNWPSTSAWTAQELYLLHVDIIESEDIFEGMGLTCDEGELPVVLDALPYSSKEYKHRAKTEPDFTKMFKKRYGVSSRRFYKAMALVILSGSSQMEESSSLHMPAEQLVQFVESRGSALPSTLSSSSDSGNFTAGQQGSPTLGAKKVTWVDSKAADSEERDQTTDVQAGASQPRPIIKSTSDTSITSVEMGTKEDASELALFALLELILDAASIEELDAHQSKQTYAITFAADEAAKSTNDGSIVLSSDLEFTNRIPLVNIECKSRKASSGTTRQVKIAAQEFGESLAIMQERLRFSKNGPRWPSTHRVFTIAMHGRRASLSRVDFDHFYLNGIDQQNLEKQRVAMRRTKQKFRLDERSDLHAFVRVVFTLFRHLAREVLDGRRV